MKNFREIAFSRILQGSVRALCLVLPFLVLSLFIPTHPLDGRSGHGVSELHEAEARRIHETFKIYSVLKSQSMDSTAAPLWNLAETILEESHRHSLDPMLVLAVINVESRFQPRAVSSRGARGLMQIRPFVANALAKELELDGWEGAKSLDDPITNVKLGAFYLGYLKKRFKDLRLALTAYNWGPTKIKNKLEREEAVCYGFARNVLATHSAYKTQSRQTQKTLPAI
jgi:soluble lytic murein transglycosylase